MDDSQLIKQAKEARKRAYVPYSKFKVGAALLAADGSIYRGCNVENASYGASICAERTALVKAVSEGQKKFKKIAIVADYPAPCSPCGICRQMLAELSPDLEVIMANTRGKSKKMRLSELLPEAFEGDSFIRPSKHK